MRTLERNWKDIYFTARDGLRLHARHYQATGSTRRPVVCLAGLTRNARDFHDIASLLSDPARHRREVFCVDYRGRGLSDHDPDPTNYSVYVEALDALDFMTIAGISDAAMIGTSRGGLVAMAIAALRPAAIGAVILNDIGPILERDGLVRIIAYVGRVPLPATWDEATALTKGLNQQHFPDVPEAHWGELARQIYNDENGRPAQGYDPRLQEALTLLDDSGAQLWPQFDALKRVPALVIRGQNSDLLSAATVSAMQARHPNLAAITVRGQGHAPLLKDYWTGETIAKFMIQHDPVEPGRG